MGLGCGASFSKYILIAVNTIFLLLGLGIGIAGLVFRFGTGLLDDKIKEALKELPVDVAGGEDIYEMVNSLSLLLIIVGFFIFIVGALGCCGACCSNRVLLVLYAIIVFLLLIAQIAAVALFVGFKSSFDDAFKKSFVHALNVTYSGTNKDLQNSFDALFKIYECCGAENYHDMPKDNLPDDCCPDTITTGTCSKDTSKVYKDGCITKLKDKIEKYNNVFLGAGISVLVFQLLCLIFAFCLCITIGRESVV